MGTAGRAGHEWPLAPFPGGGSLAVVVFMIAVALVALSNAQDAPATSGPAPADVGSVEVPGWEATPSSLAVVYALAGSPGARDARVVAERLDALLAAIARDGDFVLPGRLVYPLYPSAERFRRDWWLFAELRDGLVHGWGTVYGGDPGAISPYQVARVVVLQAMARALPLFTWGLGDAIADRLAGVDSHAHARIYLDHGGLPPVIEIVHQLDFSRALPGAHAQSVSFLAFLAEEHGLPAVAAFAREVGPRWYDFSQIFQRRFGITMDDADRRWRARVARAAAPPLSEAEFARYRRAAEFGYRHTLTRSPGGLLLQPGGAEAYVEALRATDALRRFEIDTALRAAEAGQRAAETVQRRAARTRLALRVALWALGIGPIILAVLLLAVPGLRSAWRNRLTRIRRRSAA
ncbi:MAG: hypothetical protein HY355_00095 [Armatimonadetes bacterium]|nr:hypothetical protein [Armatimonadota bacterium]